MVSGDHGETCKAIALEAGIINETEKEKDGVVMSGEQFREAIGGYHVVEDEKTGERKVQFDQKN